MAKSIVFLDTSIFITALLSDTGGSFYILNNCKDRVQFRTNEYVLSEIDEVLITKFPERKDMRTKLFLLLGITEVEIIKNPSKNQSAKFQGYISDKDLPILASAAESSDYLLTLDNEFFNQSVTASLKAPGLMILKPKMFIELSRAGRI